MSRYDEIIMAPYGTMRVCYQQFALGNKGMMQYKTETGWKTVAYYADYPQMMSAYHKEVAKMNGLLSNIYIPQLEEVEDIDGDIQTVDLWQDWGSYETMEDALSCEKDIIEAARSGMYAISDGHYYAFTIEILSSEDESIVDIVDVIEKIELDKED